MPAMNWSSKIVDIGERLGNLTLAEAAQLRDHLQEVYGIAAQRAAIADSHVKPDSVIDSAPIEPTAFDVILESVEPAQRIAAMKQVRESAGVALKEAKELVESAPRVVKQGLARADAEQLKTVLERSGAKVVIRPSTA